MDNKLRNKNFLELKTMHIYSVIIRGQNKLKQSIVSEGVSGQKKLLFFITNH